jgi:hypothetical protein
MVVPKGAQMNIGSVLMSSIYASVLTFFGSRRAVQKVGPTNTGA